MTEEKQWLLCPKCGKEMFIGYSVFNRANIGYWGHRSVILLIFGLVICCWKKRRILTARSRCFEKGVRIVGDPTKFHYLSSYFRPTVHDRIDFIENILLPTINKSPLF